MKAVAVFPGKRQVQLIEQEPPRLAAPTAVRLRMLEVGVCGTDREICAFQYGTPPAGSEHLVIGHESLGQVVEVGPAVTRLARGDLVVTMVRRPCAHAECVACRAGRQDFCFTGDFSERGIKNLHGFMTETVVDEERYMHLVPAALGEVAVLRPTWSRRSVGTTTRPRRPRSRGSPSRWLTSTSSTRRPAPRPSPSR